MLVVGQGDVAQSLTMGVLGRWLNVDRVCGRRCRSWSPWRTVMPGIGRTVNRVEPALDGVEALSTGRWDAGIGRPSSVFGPPLLGYRPELTIFLLSLLT